MTKTEMFSVQEVTCIEELFQTHFGDGGDDEDLAAMLGEETDDEEDF